MNSEAIYQALFERLQNIEGVVTASRRLRHFNHVQPEERPALFITQGNQLETPVKGLDAKIELEAAVYVYVFEADQALAPSTQLNQYLDKVREAIQPDYPEICEYQTLGGLVEHCWIDGQGIAIIPIRILVMR